MLVPDPVKGRFAPVVREGVLARRAACLRAGAMLLIGLLILLPFSGAALAQESLSDQIKRMRRDMEDIQNYLYRSTNVPPVRGSAQSAAPNPETAPRLQRQVLEMQTQMRELTGQLERINYEIGRIGTRLDKLVGDVDLRLQTLETGGLAQPAAGAAGAPRQPVVRRDSGGTTIISSKPVAGEPLPPGSNSLGIVRQQDVDAVRRDKNPRSSAAAAPVQRPAPRAAPAPRSAPGPSSVTVGGAQQAVAAPRLLPNGTVQEQYAFAFNLLRKRDYKTAEIALREFIERNPDVPLAGNAMYWMGETYYVRKEYAEAARIFLDAYQRFPKGGKAADNLIKLAKSLAQIGENESACTTYGKLLKSIPTANARILASARNDMSRLECS